MTIEGKSLYLAEHFTKSHVHPHESAIISQEISKLLPQITEEAKLNFFKLQTQRRLENEYLAYDLTSISSYSTKIHEVKYGYNRDGSKLEQINLALVIGEESLLPVYYRIMPGNISDVKTIKKMIIDSNFLKFDNVKFVMDRGFYDLKNIKLLMMEKIAFIIGGKRNISFIECYVQESIKTGTLTQNYIPRYEVYGYTYEMKIPIIMSNSHNTKYTKSMPLQVHIFFDPDRASADRIQFENDLCKSVEAVRDNECSDRQKSIFDKYCELKFNKRKDKTTIIYNTDKIEEKKSEMGYFCLVSNSCQDAGEVLKIYRHRDAVEKAFQVLKNSICNKKTTQVHSSENLAGEMFIKFISLILVAAIHKVMDTNNLYKYYSMEELLRDIDLIQRYTYPYTPTHYSEITKKQYDIYNTFDMKPPDF